jgi:hypothetical protein
LRAARVGNQRPIRKLARAERDPDQAVKQDHRIAGAG